MWFRLTETPTSANLYRCWHSTFSKKYFSRTQLSQYIFCVFSEKLSCSIFTKIAKKLHFFDRLRALQISILAQDLNNYYKILKFFPLSKWRKLAKSFCPKIESLKSKFGEVLVDPKASSCVIFVKIGLLSFSEQKNKAYSLSCVLKWKPLREMKRRATGRHVRTVMAMMYPVCMMLVPAFLTFLIFELEIAVFGRYLNSERSLTHGVKNVSDNKLQGC